MTRGGMASCGIRTRDKKKSSSMKNKSSSLNTNQQENVDKSLQPPIVNCRRPILSEPIHGTTRSEGPTIPKKRRSSLCSNMEENMDGSSQPDRPEPIYRGSMRNPIGEALSLIKKRRSASIANLEANWEREMDDSSVHPVDNSCGPHLSEHANSGSTSIGTSHVGEISHGQQRKKTRGSTSGVKAPAAGQKKVKVRVLANTMVPIQARTKIGPIIKQHYTKVITSWREVEKEQVDLMWGEYLKYFRFVSREEEARGRHVWEKILRRNFANYLHSWKREAMKKYGSVRAARNHKPGWTSLEVWQKLCDYWMSEKFLKASALRKKNRASTKGIVHTSGNITYEERQIELFNKLGRAPTQFETFSFTHLVQGKDGRQYFPNEESANLADEYANKLREKHGLAPDQSVTEIEDPGLEIWQECVGGVTRGRLIGRPGERWSKTGVSKEYDTHIASQEYSKKLERLEKDNKKKAKREAKLYKIVNSQSSYISEQGSYISEQGSYISEMSQYLQGISEKFGIPAPPHFTVRPPPMPPSTNDGASANASGVPDGPSSSRGCDDFNTEDNGDSDDEFESEDD